MACEFGFENVDDVDLDDELGLEVAACIEAEVGVAGAREAVHARLAAPAVGADGPVDRHLAGIAHAVECALGEHLVKGNPLELGGLDRANEVRNPGQAREGARRFTSDLLRLPAYNYSLLEHVFDSVFGRRAVWPLVELDPETVSHYGDFRCRAAIRFMSSSA